MGVDGGGGGCCCNRSRVHAVGRFLFLLALLAQEASIRLVDGPHHVVLTPMKGIVPMFFFLGFSFLGRHSLPCLVLLLSFLVGSILLALLLLAFLLVILVLSFGYCS
jgi:hypothetical protein